jgi:integrase
MNKLTDVNIKKAKPGDKTRKLSDGGGLYLQIEPTGGKLWKYKYRFEGKEKKLALGKYPDVSLQQAREWHQDARKLLANGVDPGALKKAQKAAGEERAANSFEVIALEWFSRWKDDKAAGTVSRAAAILKKDVNPYIGGRPISEVKAPETLAVLRRIEDRGCGKMARKVRDVLSVVFRYAVQTGRIEYNPCDNLRGALKPVSAKHMAAITEPAKVAELLRSIDAYKGTPATRAALRLAPMFFCRPGELRQMKWADVDLDRAEWGYRVSKTKTEHLVPLAKQAIEILKDLYQLTGHGEHVFAGIRPGRPMSNMTVNRALQTLGYDTKTEITGHGFRAMARTLLAERLRFPENVIEHQLAHKVPDALGTAYNRTKFIDDRRRMMQSWADYLDELKATEFGKVVQFEHKAV